MRGIGLCGKLQRIPGISAGAKLSQNFIGDGKISPTASYVDQRFILSMEIGAAAGQKRESLAGFQKKGLLLRRMGGIINFHAYKTVFFKEP